MKLVYLSPVALSSFEQRPQNMVRELLRGSVFNTALWIDPYPTRLPRLADLRRPSDAGQLAVETDLPIRVLKPRALPIEPLQFGRRLNNCLFFSGLLADLDDWLGADRFLVAIGKPCPLAIALLDRFANNPRCVGTVYDRMDRFAAFHTGLSSRAMKKWEHEVLRKASRVQVASTSLLDETRALRPDAVLCANGYNDAAIRETLSHGSASKTTTLGYIGTVGGWFDWEWTLRLARRLDDERSELVIRVIGPCFDRPPGSLPTRVTMEPALPHGPALQEMLQLRVGLIPFKMGALTEGVDPIKYYEYRALGLPVVATPFGELRYRTSDPGLFLTDPDSDSLPAIQSALRFESRDASAALAGCTWKDRFAPLVDWARQRGSA
jgi:hypothetical protein